MRPIDKARKSLDEFRPLNPWQMMLAELNTFGETKAYERVARKAGIGIDTAYYKMKAMKRNGLITVQKKGYANHITLTPKGREVQADVKKVMEGLKCK